MGVTDRKARAGLTLDMLTGMQDTMAAMQTAVAGKVTSPQVWADVTGKPATFPPAAHGHSIADVTGLQAALDVITARLPVLVGTATLAETGITTLSLSVRKLSVAVSGVITGGNYLAFPVSATPAGYAINDVVCTASGTLQFTLTVPILTVGSYSIPVRVVRILT